MFELDQEMDDFLLRMFHCEVLVSDLITVWRRESNSSSADGGGAGRRGEG